MCFAVHCQLPLEKWTSRFHVTWTSERTNEQISYVYVEKKMFHSYSTTWNPCFSERHGTVSYWFSLLHNGWRGERGNFVCWINNLIQTRFVVTLYHFSSSHPPPHCSCVNCCCCCCFAFKRTLIASGLLFFSVCILFPLYCTTLILW